MYLFFFKQRFSSLANDVKLWIIVQVYGPFVLGYGPLFRSMSRYAVLWIVISVYGPLCSSMDRYCDLCAFTRVYGPLFQSMGLPSILWTDSLILWTVAHVLWTFTKFYEPPASFPPSQHL